MAGWQRLQALDKLCAVDQPVPVIEDRRFVHGDPLADRRQIGGAELAGDDVRRRAHRDDREIGGIHARAANLKTAIEAALILEHAPGICHIDDSGSDGLEYRLHINFNLGAGRFGICR